MALLTLASSPFLACASSPATRSHVPAAKFSSLPLSRTLLPSSRAPGKGQRASQLIVLMWHDREQARTNSSCRRRPDAWPRPSPPASAGSSCQLSPLSTVRKRGGSSSLRQLCHFCCAYRSIAASVTSMNSTLASASSTDRDASPMALITLNTENMKQKKKKNQT